MARFLPTFAKQREQKGCLWVDVPEVRPIREFESINGLPNDFRSAARCAVYPYAVNAEKDLRPIVIFEPAEETVFPSTQDIVA